MTKAEAIARFHDIDELVSKLQLTDLDDGEKRRGKTGQVQFLGFLMGVVWATEHLPSVDGNETDVLD